MSKNFDAPKIARKMLTWEALVILLFIAPVAIFAASTIGKTPLSSLTSSSLSNGLTLYYTFDGPDMIQQHVIDKSNREGFFGDLFNFTSTTTASGPIGEALTFNGASSNYVATHDSLSDVFTVSASSISIWIKPTAAAPSTPANVYNGAGIIGDSNGYNGLYQTNLNGTDKIWAYNWDGGEDHVGITYTLNQWVHVVMVHTGGTLYIYKNGVFADSVASGDTSNLTGSEYVGKGYTSEGGTFFTGSIDDVRIYNRALSATEINRLYGLGATTHIGVSPTTGLAAPAAASGASNGLVGWWTFDGKNMLQNVVDSSGTGSTGRLAGFTSTTTIEGAIGQALDFPAIGRYIDVGTGHIVFSKTSPFSISGWVKATTANTNTIMMANYDVLITGGWSLGYSSGHVGLTIKDGGTANGFSNFGLTDTRDNKWHSFVMTYDGSVAGSGIKVYTDGVLNTMTNPAATGTGDPGTLTDAGFIIGGSKALGSPAAVWVGGLDDLRVYNRVLTPAEVTKLNGVGATTHVGASPTSGLAAPAAASGASNGLVAWWTFDGKNMLQNVADSSGSGSAGRLISFTSTTTTEGKIGQALQFDGVDDYVLISSATAVLPNFTLAAWVNISNVNLDADVCGAPTQINCYPIISKGYDAADVSYFLDFRNNSAGLVPFIEGGMYDGTTHAASSTVSWASNTWHHAAVTFDGSTYRTYADGVLGASKADATAIPANTQATTIGAFIVSGTPQRFMNQKIDDARIYNRALTAAEIQRLYDIGR